MKIKIIYYPPYDSISGKRSEEIKIKESSISVLDLLQLLIIKYPKIKSYIQTANDEQLRSQMNIVADSNLLGINDRIKEDISKEIKILPPIAGGMEQFSR